MRGVSQPRSPGPAPWVAPGGAALLLASVVFDLALSGRLTLFFDLCFVVGCLALALTVRLDGWVAAGVGPPVAMLVGFAVLAAADPAALADPRDGVVQATVTGLAHHSGALAAGYALCLATLAVRRRRADLAPSPRPDEGAGAGTADGADRPQATKRATSPAP